MDNLELLEEIGADDLDPTAVPIVVGQNIYFLSSLKTNEEVKRFREIIQEQNEKIDNLTEEEKANRAAQFRKSIKGTARKN